MRFSLYTQILLWLVLNFIVLVLVGGALAWWALGGNAASLMNGPLGDRAAVYATAVSASLEQEPQERWEEVLAHWSSELGVGLTLVNENGLVIAGQQSVIPNAVRAAMQPRGRPGGGDPLGLGPRGGPPPSGPARSRVFLASTEVPNTYWVGIRLPPRPPALRGPQIMVLLATTDSLWQVGVLIGVHWWLLAVIAVFGVSALLWYPLVRAVTGRIRRLQAVTEAIADGQLDSRVRTVRGDEIGRLGQAVDRLAERLEGFVGSQKRFVSDVAHELCSPLARLQLAIGILEERVGAGDASVGDVRDEVQQLSDMVNELLTFSKAGLQGREVIVERVVVAELVQRVLAREGAAGRVQTHVDPSIVVMAEGHLLSRAIANLVRNSVRYAGDRGSITISAQREGTRVRIVVADEGPGVPPDVLDRLGEPFFRPEAARTRETGGVGLGLAIVRTCIDACKGTVRLRNREPRGFEVTVELAAA